MKKMVLVSDTYLDGGLDFPTPYAHQPNSLDSKVFQMSLSRPWRSLSICVLPMSPGGRHDLRWGYDMTVYSSLPGSEDHLGEIW